MRLPKTPVVSLYPAQPSDLALLRRAPFFARLSDEQLQRLMATARVEEFSTGATVLHCGANCGAVFVALSGTLRVYLPQATRYPAVLNLVGREEVIGEICAADGAGHTASIAAVERSRLLRIERAALLALKEETPDLRAAWERLLTRRLRSINARQAALASGTVAQRVARMLAEFAVRYQGEPQGAPGSEPEKGRRGPGTVVRPLAVTIPLCLRQDDLASLVNACRYRVNDSLGDLEARGVIEQRPAQRFIVLDLPSLLGRAS